MKFKFLFLIISTIPLITSGCQNIHDKMRPPSVQNFIDDSNGIKLVSNKAENSSIAALPLSVINENTSSIERKVIFNGSCLIQVGDLEQAQTEIRKITEHSKGWLHKIEDGVLTLRVPADKFHALMDDFKKIGRILDKKISGSDVTEEFFDLEVRINNSEEIRKRLIELLDKAADVKEALEVEREIARLTLDIERMKCKLKLLSDQISYSTITIALVQNIPAAHIPDNPIYPFNWIQDLGIDNLIYFRD